MLLFLVMLWLSSIFGKLLWLMMVLLIRWWFMFMLVIVLRFCGNWIVGVLGLKRMRLVIMW